MVGRHNVESTGNYELRVIEKKYTNGWNVSNKKRPRYYADDDHLADVIYMTLTRSHS